MTDEQLSKANSLRDKIKKLNHFIDTFSKVPRKSIVFKNPRYKLSLKRKAHWIYETEEYELDEETEERIIEVLKERENEMKEEYRSI